MSIFTVSARKPKRNFFPLQYVNTMSIQDFGILYPMFCKEMVPSDVWKHNHAAALNFFPQSTNVHHSFYFNTYYFFVPNRIIYKDWDKFFSQVSGQYSTPYVSPFASERHLINAGLSQNNKYVCHGSLFDYLNFFSLPKSNISSVDTTLSTSNYTTLPVRAYQKIWRDHFLDEEVNALVTEANQLDSVFEVGGSELTSLNGSSAYDLLFKLRSKSWNKDRFTTALKNRRVAGFTPRITGTFGMDELRNMGAINSFAELMMRAGQRTQELTHAIYGVYPKDYRIDQAEFLCGSSVEIVKGTIFNADMTVNNSDGDPVTEQTQGYKVSDFKLGDLNGEFKYAATEHGWLIGLCCLVPRAVYFQGVDRKFIKSDPTDWFIPQFENIGDEMTLNKELFYQIPTSSTVLATNNSGFGFSERYSHLKYWDNEVHGYFRDTAYLDYHDAKVFSSLPARNNVNFSQITNYAMSTNTWTDPAYLKRIFHVTSGSPIATLEILHKVRALRPMQHNAIPKFRG